MVRKNFYMSDKDLVYLKKRDGITVSEHLRRAIENYISDLKYLDQMKALNVSNSSSKHGRKS